MGEAELLRAPRGAKVADAMRRVACAVAEDASLGHALALLAAQRADALAVVSSDGVLVGVLAAADVVSLLAAQLG